MLVKNVCLLKKNYQNNCGFKADVTKSDYGSKSNGC